MYLKIEKGPLFDRNVRKAGLVRVVGVAGLEPTASWSRTKRSTKLLLNAYKMA